MGDTQDRLTSSLAFAVTEAIQSGALDEFLGAIAVAVRERNAVFDQRRPPPRSPEMAAKGQVWAWMNYDDKRSRWEVRGTGVLWDPAWGERRVPQED